MDYLQQRNEVAAFMKRVYDRGLTTCLGGNISFKVDDDIMLITPSGKDKATLKAEDIIIYSLSENKNLTSHLRASMETDMHKSIYAERDDVFAVMHAHPVCASCFTATEKKINLRLIAEALYVLKKIEDVPYSLMGTSDLADNVKIKAKDANVLMLENHGVVTLGKTLFDAFDKIEVLENAAKMTILSGVLGEQKELSDSAIDEIMNFFI